MFRKLRQVGGIALLVIAIGLASVIRHVILLWIGGEGYGYGLELQRRQFFLGLEMTPRDLMIVLVSLAVMAGLDRLHPQKGQG